MAIWRFREGQSRAMPITPAVEAMPGIAVRTVTEMNDVLTWKEDDGTVGRVISAVNVRMERVGGGSAIIQINFRVTSKLCSTGDWHRPGLTGHDFELMNGDQRVVRKMLAYAAWQPHDESMYANVAYAVQSPEIAISGTAFEIATGFKIIALADTLRNNCPERLALDIPEELIARIRGNKSIAERTVEEEILDALETRWPKT